MSEENDVQRIDCSLVHPAVAMAALMAHWIYARQSDAISADEITELFNSTAASEAWRDHGINLRTAVLMVATALQLQATLGQRDGLLSATSPLDPAAAEASMHARRTERAVAALSALADQFGGGTRT